MALTLIFISVACEPHPSHQLLEWGVFADIFFTQELAFTVDFAFIVRGIPISALVLHYPTRNTYDIWRFQVAIVYER